MSTSTLQSLSPGNGTDYPKERDEITMEYTGWISDPNAPGGKGSQFDSSVGRGDFKTPIGVGRVIVGWDTLVPKMSLGERALLTIPPNEGYGARGFPPVIPPNSTLLFEVQLKGINGKTA